MTHSGRISAEVAKKKAGEEYAKFHQRTMYELSPVELHFIETGRYMPSTIVALKIARHFGKHADEIFQLEEND